MAYLDNIIIYFNTEKEYKEHIEWVLKKLYKENIPIAVFLFFNFISVVLYYVQYCACSL